MIQLGIARRNGQKPNIVSNIIDGHIQGLFLSAIRIGPLDSIKEITDLLGHGATNFES